jgi:hypothetical protein
VVNRRCRKERHIAGSLRIEGESGVTLRSDYDGALEWHVDA